MNQITLPKTGVLIGGTVLAIAAFALFGIQNAYAMITSQMDLGDRGSQVSELQTYLSTDVNLYPSGLVTGYYGQLTKAGVERFQTAQGIVSAGTPATTGYGRVGPQTILALNGNLSTGGDVYAPMLSHVNVMFGSTSAALSWSTNEAARGKVYYSTSPIRISNVFDVNGTFSGEPTVSGSLASYDGVARTTQSINITGLSANTTYYYLVVSLDASNNVNITAPASFHTAQ